jgi:hypothetical protein
MPCEEEEKVKEYHCARMRSKIIGMVVAEGTLTVTNKRVIYRTIGVYDDRNFVHDEVAIEDVAGVALHRGRVFDITSMIISYIGLMIVALSIYMAQEGLLPVPLVIAFVVWWVVRRAERIASTMSRVAADPLAAALRFFGTLRYWLWPVRDLLTITIASKGGSTGPIHVEVPKKMWTLDISAQVWPAGDYILLVNEIGMIINNLQKYGAASLEGMRS